MDFTDVFESCATCGDHVSLHTVKGCLLCNCSATGEEF